MAASVKPRIRCHEPRRAIAKPSARSRCKHFAASAERLRSGRDSTYRQRPSFPLELAEAIRRSPVTHLGGSGSKRGDRHVDRMGYSGRTIEGRLAGRSERTPIAKAGVVKLADARDSKS